ncbi:MAG TPA: thioredoxin-like domain-containing protein [Chitinophagaceae bacterium]|nr:thioredoxin-like domain-containing protein [Chitinophagaceae bacterium]
MNPRLLLTTLALLIQSTLLAQNAWQIKVTLKPFTSGYLFLAHHYGSKQMLVDSAAIDKNSQAVFQGKEKLAGGIYMIVFPKKDGWIEVILDKEQNFTLTADSADLIRSMTVTGSNDNLLFKDYLLYSQKYGSEMNELQKQYKAATTKADSARLETQLQAKSKELKIYRDKFIIDHPQHLLSSVFKVFREPVIPPDMTDQVARNQYYRRLYWDSMDLNDERLIRTPVLQSKYDRFFDDIVPPVPDTLIMEVDELMLRVRANEEMKKYTLLHLTDKYVNPKYMGQDKVFVHMFTKYYIPGDADAWLNEKYRKFIFDRGYSLMMNVIGEKAANINMVDTSGKKKTLYEVVSPYTVVCFWDPGCSHCQVEVPKLDSLYKNKWRSKGVQMFGVMTDGGLDKWKAYIREHNLNNWIHVYQTQELKDNELKSGQPGFRQLYDVYQTPMLYLLDKDKKILAKKLNYEQLNEFLDHKFNSTSPK